MRQASLRAAADARDAAGADVLAALDELLQERSALTRRLLGQPAHGAPPDGASAPPMPQMLRAFEAAGLPIRRRRSRTSSEARRRGLPHRRDAAARRGRAAVRGARLRVAVVPRAHAHPGLARDALSGRRRPALDVLALAGPVRRADRRRDGDHRAAARHRDLPRDRARPDHHGQGGRVAGPAQRRASRVRRRRRVEPRGDAQPRHRSAHAHGGHGRARRGDQDDLDRNPRRRSTASTSRSTGSGPGPSPSRTRTRASGSAATARPSRTACWRFGDGWMPNVVNDDELLGAHRGAALARGLRRAGLDQRVAPRGRSGCSATPRRASSARSSTCPAPAATRSRSAWTRCRSPGRSSSARAEVWGLAV